MTMRRRDFILGAAAAAQAVAGGGTELMTVTGMWAPGPNDAILPHEHLFSKFGDTPVEKASYDTGRVLATLVPYLDSLKGMGCAGIADCTAAYFGRDPALLRQISEKTGLRILTNTGYYGAAKKLYIPPSAYTESAEEISLRWVKEWNEGIGGTLIKPGFIKLGVDPGPLQEINRKLLRAAALTHLQSGLTDCGAHGRQPERGAGAD